jgi:subtilisin family serine protease
VYVLPKACTPADTGEASAIVAVIAVTARTELNLRERVFISDSFFGGHSDLETNSTVAFPFVNVKRLIALCIVAAGASQVPASLALTAPVGASWHLDRINQAHLPLDGNSALGTLTGAGIDIYIVDTGIRPTHEQVTGRVLPGIDIPTDNGSSKVNPVTSDCDGHGTHVAGLAAGSTVGVATQARLISVRVLDCNGDGEVADVVDALQWVRAHHRSGVSAVMNLSFGVDLGDDGTSIDREVQALIDEGVVVTVASGNGDAAGRPIDACKIAPGDVPDALTVGAVGISDVVSYYSNNGPCVDLYAPGGDRTRGLESAWKDSDTDYEFDVGTSMASPLVAGYAALLAQQQPGLCATSISNAIVDRSTKGVITGVTADSFNRLLLVDTTPIPATAPGKASHVIISTDSQSLVASWDSPCDGGSVVTGTKVSLLQNGKVVKRANIPVGTNAVRFTGLVLGRRYQVVIKASNAVGEGIATSRITTMPVRRIFSGQSIDPSSLSSLTSDLPLIWSVSQASKTICRLQPEPFRLVALRKGICRVGLRGVEGQDAVIRSLRID